MPKTDPAPGSWNTWAPVESLLPRCTFDGECWLIEAGDGPSYHGGWDLIWHHFQPGQWYQIDVACRADGVAAIQDNVRAEWIWWKDGEKRSDWAHVRFEPMGDRYLRFVHQMQAPADATSGTLRLTLRWTDQGKIAWCDPQLKPIDPPAPRKFTAAVATGNFPGTSVEDNVRYACDLVRRAADRGAHVVCLPECVTTWGLDKDPFASAHPLRGPETDALCKAATASGVDVVTSVNARDGSLVYNTGIYMDAAKGLIGQYRKVHLAVSERWNGVTPGDEFPVWKTRHGTAGMLICFDSVMPEGHRILSQKGAEVLYMPIMGDPRAVGDHAEEIWRRIMQVRAMDNHVWFVVSRNKGQWSVIVRPDGEIVAEMNDMEGIATAEIDLDFRHASWIGSDFRNRTWGERRPHLYGRLTESV